MSDLATPTLGRLWTPLRYHSEQARFWASNARFQLAAAGRRSGKSDIAKRKTKVAGCEFTEFPDGKFVFSAPTRPQAKEIYWEDLKESIPRRFVADIRETDLSLRLVTGTRFVVAGTDEPERLEGSPIDWIVLDEYGAMKERVWMYSIRPALSTPGRPGRAIFIGKPKGRNHFYELYRYARSKVDPDWEAFHWKSSEIIDPDEDDSARRGMDRQTYAQEYDAEFISLEGRIYYAFEASIHAGERLPYYDTDPIVFAFDFNRKPGIAEVLQEQRYRGKAEHVAGDITASIGEVWIRDSSTTPAVCRKLIADWGLHKGHVFVYGDATGGAKGSAKVEGSDWTLVERELRPVFRERLHMRVDRANPAERVRVNAVNSRLRTADGTVHWLVDPAKCPRLVEDFEGVLALEGGSGEIDKDGFPMLSHVSDAVGYYAHKRHPLVRHTITSDALT